MIAKFAEIGDFNSGEYQKNYFELEEFSNRFLESALKSGFFPKDYPWPIDPFHNWSRIWEYPFVWEQIKGVNNNGEKPLRVADLGSGLTFFPWFLASKGNSVYALDNNLRLIPSKKMIGEMKRELDIKGDIYYLASDATRISLRDNSVDAVTNISLLEHLPDYYSSLDESNRILMKNGSLIATFDVSLDGLPFGDGTPLNLNQVNKIVNLKFNSIPKKSLRFSNHPRNWSNRKRLRFYSLGDIWKWEVKNQYLRPLIKLIKSRIFIPPYPLIPVSTIRLLISPNRFDMWTVMGIALQKSSINR